VWPSDGEVLHVPLLRRGLSHIKLYLLSMHVIYIYIYYGLSVVKDKPRHFDILVGYGKTITTRIRIILINDVCVKCLDVESVTNKLSVLYIKICHLS
jgi:hypothetical protein